MILLIAVAYLGRLGSYFGYYKQNKNFWLDFFPCYKSTWLILEGVEEQENASFTTSNSNGGTGLTRRKYQSEPQSFVGSSVFDENHLQDPATFDQDEFSNNLQETQWNMGHGQSRHKKKSPVKVEHHAKNSPMDFSACGVSHKVQTLLDRPLANVMEQKENTWSKTDHSMNIYIKEREEFCTFHREPVAQSTDAARGVKGYSQGLHAWEVSWPPRQRGTHAVIGVCTKDAPLHSQGYVSLVGSNKHSWGWDINKKRLIHNPEPEESGAAAGAADGEDVEMEAVNQQSAALNNLAAGALPGPAISPSIQSKPYPTSMIGPNGSEPVGTIPEKIIMVLDMDQGELSFFAKNRFLGTAFTGLQGRTLYPVISCVWGHCEISLKYIAEIESGPLSLRDGCRHVIRKYIGATDITPAPASHRHHHGNNHHSSSSTSFSHLPLSSPSTSPITSSLPYSVAADSSAADTTQLLLAYRNQLPIPDSLFRYLTYGVSLKRPLTLNGNSEDVDMQCSNSAPAHSTAALSSTAAAAAAASNSTAAAAANKWSINMDEIMHSIPVIKTR